MKVTHQCTLGVFSLCTLSLLLIVLVLFEQHLEDLWDQYDGTDYVHRYLRTSLQPQFAEDDLSLSCTSKSTQDKVIVMAKVAYEDTAWVDEHLWDWQNAIYTVNPSTFTPNDTLTTPFNKGHEAMAYLTYIVDHYYTLPSTIAFLHSHRSGFRQAWHTDAPLHDNVFAMQNLRVGTVQRHGYVNLRCKRNPGCVRIQSKNGHITERVWEQVFQGTSTWPHKNSSHPLRNSQIRAAEVEDTKMPSHILAACCAQFAVSRMQVLQRPLQDYVSFRQWVIDTELDDAHSGRVMEYLWHIIFSKDAVHCPDEETCYCDVYGRC